MSLNLSTVSLNDVNSFRPTLTTSKELFKSFMGKEYNSTSDNAIEHVVYHLFKNCEKPKQDFNIDFKINHLHSFNQLAILTHSRNLALANNHFDIAKHLMQKIALIEKNVTFTAPFTFNDKLEDKTMSTVLKIAGLVIVTGLITFALTKAFIKPQIPHNVRCYQYKF
ncbi:MAG TPA: hypothetical protein VGP47_08520 [Parachlamydiaceae bacterium]|nr:hypothetical protein [Parachlamydiaceae bacterium]